MVLQYPISPNYWGHFSSFEKGIRNPLHEGTCWIRIGESKHEVKRQEIASNEAPYAYCYAQVPYLLPSHWLRYFAQLTLDRCLSQAEAIQGYQPLLTTTNDTVKTIMDRFLNESKQMLVLIGAAGSGKTAAVRRLIAQLAIYGKQEIEVIRQNEEFRPPSQWIPLYISLNGLQVGNKSELLQYIVAQVNRLGEFWDEAPTNPEKLLEKRDIRWLLCLDGLDELPSDNDQRQLISAVRVIMTRYPSIKILLTARPDAALPDFLQWPETETATIATLGDAQISAFVSNFVDADEFSAYLGFFRSNPELWTLCAYPLYMSAILQELVGLQQQGLIEDRQVAAAESSTTEDNLEVTALDEEESLPEPLGDAQLSPPEGLVEGQQNGTQFDSSLSHEVILPISLGRLLDQVYQKLWEREQKRQLMPLYQADDWWQRTAKLASDTDGHKRVFRRDDAIQILNDGEVLMRLLSLGIVEAKRPRELLSFRTILTKAYFAASWICLLVETGDLNEASTAVKQMTDDFCTHVRQIVTDLTSIDVSPIFP